MKTKLFVAAMASLLVFASCVKDIESASVTNVRNAKAAELTSIAAYNNALAEAAVITANAEAALKAAQAEYQKAQAELVKAQAELVKVQTEEERTRLELLIVELETAKARSAAELERIAQQMELELEQHKLELFKAQQAYIEYAKGLEEAERQHLIAVSAAYTKAVEDLIDLQVEKINAEAAIAALEAGLESQGKFIDAQIENALADIAFYDAEIANLKKYIYADAAELTAALDKAYLAQHDAHLAWNETASVLEKAESLKEAAWAKVTEGKFETGVTELNTFAKDYFGDLYLNQEGAVSYKNEYEVLVPLFKKSYMGEKYITYKDWAMLIEDFTPAEIYGDNFKAPIDKEIEAENAKHEKSLKENEYFRNFMQREIENLSKVTAAYPESMQKEIKAAYDDLTERIDSTYEVINASLSAWSAAYDAMKLNEKNAVYIAGKAREQAIDDLTECQNVIDTKPDEIARYKNEIGEYKYEIAIHTNQIENVLKPALTKNAADVKANNEKLAAAEKKVAEFKLDEKKEKELSTRLDYYAHQSAEDAETYKKAWDDAVKALNDVLDDEGYKAAVAEVKSCKDEAARLETEAIGHNTEIAYHQGVIQTQNEAISGTTAELEEATAEYNGALAGIDALNTKVKEADAAYEEAVKAEGLADEALDEINSQYYKAQYEYYELRAERNNVAVVDYVRDYALTDLYVSGLEQYSSYRQADVYYNFDGYLVKVLLPGNNTWNNDARETYKQAVEDLSENAVWVEAYDKFVEMENKLHEENITFFNNLKQSIDDCISLKEGYLADIEAAKAASDNYIAVYKAYLDAYEAYIAAGAEMTALFEVYNHDDNINNQIDEILGYEQDLIDYVNELIEAYNDEAQTLEILKAKLPIYDAKIAAQEKLVESLEAELNALLGE